VVASQGSRRQLCSRHHRIVRLDRSGWRAHHGGPSLVRTDDGIAHRAADGARTSLPGPSRGVVLSTAALSAVVAVTEVETHAELGERTAQVQRTLRRVVDASDSERQRIERDLHDGAQQHFVALSVQFRVLARLATTDTDTERANSLIDALLAEIDEASHDLTALVEGRFPEGLSEGRLADAVRRIAAQSAMPVTVETTGANNVPVQLAAPAYFCCREAIQNASKHAGAGAQLRVRVDATDHLLTFEVSDDGVGFDPYARSPGGGLRSLRDRVEAVGGTFTVRSELGNGTTVTAPMSSPSITQTIDAPQRGPIYRWPKVAVKGSGSTP